MMVYMVAVKYSGDIAIEHLPKNDPFYNKPIDWREKDNQRGFTKLFHAYKEALRYARHVARELQIPHP